MSSSWDTFTKNSEQEELLNYDDTAANYFMCSVLACIIFPWTYQWVRYYLGWTNEAGQFPKTTPKNGHVYRYAKDAPAEENTRRIDQLRRMIAAKSKRWTFFKLGMLCVLWMVFSVSFFNLATNEGASTVKGFNPFDILEVTPSDDDVTVKKAYRKMSLIYHPDKNPDDPLASSKFIQVSKAYKTLTDAAARLNWEKYGNPDGPQTTKVGIGLPRFLLEKENHLLILCAFFAIFLVIIPALLIWYYQRQKEYAANGVLVETLQFLGHYISADTRVKNGPELLAASAESRAMQIRPQDESEMKPLLEQVVEYQKRKFNMPIIIRNNYLISAHLQRFHGELSDGLRDELDQLLLFTDRVTTSMIEIACVREWLATAQALIEFRRSLIQGLDVKAGSSQSLLQIPHFNEEAVKHCARGNQPIKDILAFLNREKEQRRGVAHMTETELLDVDEFCRHMTQIDVETKCEVEGEKMICKDDVATVTVKVTRTNLQDKEALGYIHAPLFPELKMEEWYIFLVENNKIICYERVKKNERVFLEKLRFHVGRKGKHNLQVILMNDSYAGVDVIKKIDFDAHSPEDDKERSIYVHPEDEKLDLHPTLFQQLMGEMNQDDESEDEDQTKEPEASGKVSKAKAKADGAKGGGDGEGSDSDSDSDSSSSSSDDEAGATKEAE